MPDPEIKKLVESFEIKPHHVVVLRGRWSNSQVEDFCDLVGKHMQESGKTGPEYPGSVFVLHEGQSIELLPECVILEAAEHIKEKRS